MKSLSLVLDILLNITAGGERRKRRKRRMPMASVLVSPVPTQSKHSVSGYRITHVWEC